MNKSAQVLSFLLPQGGWVLYGEEYEGIQFIECDPISKEEFEAGFEQFDAWKAEEESSKILAKQALLDRLGITAEEAKLLLS
jgi:hypothetical protein